MAGTPKTDFDPEVSDPSLQYRARQEAPFFTPEGGYIAGDSPPLWKEGDAAKVVMQAMEVPYNLGFGGGPETDAVYDSPAFTKEDMKAYQQSQEPESPLGKVMGWGAQQAGLLPFYLTTDVAAGAPLAAKAGQGLSKLATTFPKLSPAIKKTTPYAKSFASGFGSGAPVGAMEGYKEEGSAKEAAQKALESGLTFGGMNMGMKLLGGGGRTALNKLSGIKTETPRLPEGELFPPGKVGMAESAPMRGKNPLLGEGSISAAKFTVPEKMADVGDGTKVRSLGVSAMRNPEFHPDVKAGLLMESMEGGAGTYTPITNKGTISEAQRMIDADINGALRHAKENPGTALSNVIELEMVKKANSEGRFNDAIDIITEVSGRSTTQGQAIQSLRLWGKMSPEGMQKFYVKTIKDINKDLEKQMGKKAKKLITDPKIMEDIKGRMDKIGKMPDGRGKDIEVAKTLDLIASQVPVPFLRKVSSIQIMAQLLNPKTAIRNIGGNTGFMGLENVSDVVGAGVDKALSMATGKRTKVLPSLTAQAKGMKQGWKHGLEEALLGIDTKGLATKQDLPKSRVFRGKIGGNLETALAIELRATDRAFYQAAYDGSLNNQMRAAKVTEPTQEMKDIAHYDGLYRTFQDDNALSKGFQGIKRILNAQKEFGIGDFVIKYPRTPANLLMRGIEYSPAGFVKTIITAAKPLAKHEFNQREFVESFSRALVGSTALVGTGALLNKLGIVTGKPVADKDLAELQREQGFGEYRINASALKRLVFGGDVKPQQGDKIVSYNWFQPAALPIAIGADINVNKGEPTGIIGTIMQAFGTGINALADQPVAQGIQTLLSSGYGGDVTQGLEKVMEGIPSSFMPTLLNQVKQLADNQRRETYDSNKKQKALNLAKNKIPGLSQTLPLKYGTLGQKLETYQNKGNNPFNVFLNPAFINKFNPSKEMQKVNSIYEQTGETIQVPRVADKSITVSGRKFVLTGQDYAEYQRLLGEYTQQKFATLKPDATAKQMQDIMADANARAKTEILKAKGVGVKPKGGGLTLK